MEMEVERESGGGRDEDGGRERITLGGEGRSDSDVSLSRGSILSRAPSLSPSLPLPSAPYTSQRDSLDT